MISKEEFYKRIQNLSGEILSKTGEASYSELRVEQPFLHFKRNETGKYWKLDIDILYSIYEKNEFINTTVIKNATGGQVNSPSVAILIAIKCLDKNGNRITN